MSFLAVMLVAVVELVLAAAWVRAYYAIGLPLFWRRVPIALKSDTSELQTQLEHRFEDDAGPGLAFHKVSEVEVAFRERFFDFVKSRYTPVMHGVVQLVPHERVAIVKGMANWSVLAVFALFISIAGLPVFFYLVAVVAFAISYGCQVRRYMAVARVIAQVSDMGT